MKTKGNNLKTVRKASIFICAICFIACMIAVLFCSTGTNIAFAAEQEDISISENYDRSSVLVVLSKQATFSFKKYEASDFDEIGCTDVVELTTETLEVVKQQLNDKDNVNDNEKIVTQEIDLEKYRRILELKISIHNSINLDTVISNLEKRQDISCASLNYIHEDYSENNFENNVSDMYVTMDMRQWAIDAINLPQAWNITTGSSEINVGILDTGIDGSHSVLSQNLNNDLHRDFRNATITVTNTPFDTGFHGTHVAGIVGLKANSAYAKGVCDNVNLVSLVISENGYWYSDNVILAVEYATAHNINVLNYSGRVRDRNGIVNVDDPVLKQAINQYPGLFVVAAGNEFIDIDTGTQYPAKYSTSLSNVIAVGSLSYNNNRSSFSNYGANTVNIYAPGSQILSSFPVSLCQSKQCDASTHYADGYHYLDGTSMATPYVTGVAALLLSQNSMLTGAELKKIILNNADNITISTPSGNQNVKKLNAYKAVLSLSPSFKVTLHSEGNVTNDKVITVKYGETLPEFFAPEKYGYAFDGYYDKYGKKYYGMEVKNDPQTAQINGYDNAYREFAVPVAGIVWDKLEDTTLYGRWDTVHPFACDYSCNAFDYETNKYIGGGTVRLTQGPTTVDPPTIDKYEFQYFTYLGTKYYAGQNIPLNLYRAVGPNKDSFQLDGVLYAYYKEAPSCIAPGTLITLADGRQVPVEELTGNEMLLVWNLYTGSYDISSILFIDSDPLQLYKVINLSFSDGTTVNVISEHGFWDYDLNKYVYLDAGAEKYIGHWFNKGDERVQLVSVEIIEEYTTAWSPVTYGHLCYFVNGMLSMPGGIDGLFNIFDVDSETMRYDGASMQADIDMYGLYTYEEFAELLPVSEVVFEAFNAKYFKVAIGKGLISFEHIASLYSRYAEFLVTQS